jgi:hypothetical protein
MAERKGEIEMATVQAQAERTVEQLLAAVKQLSPVQLCEFERRFAAWRKQTIERVAPSIEETAEQALLTCIQENAGLSAPEQRRFDRLRRKNLAKRLTKAEEHELQALWRRVEQMNVARLGALVELARRRGVEVKTLMNELGLPENRDVF